MAYWRDAFRAEQRRGPPRQVCHPVAEIRKAWIVGLTVHEPVVDLLNHDGDLEEREHLVELEPGKVAAAARGVALDELARREPAWQRRHRRERVALFRRRGRGPIGQQDPQVDERIAESRHFPVEHRDQPAWIRRVQQQVVQLEVAVDDRGLCGRRRQRLDEPACHPLHLRQVGRSGSVPSLRPPAHLPFDEPVRFAQM